MRRVMLFALVISVIAWAAPVGAQQSIDAASVSGRVTDPSGAILPGARVTVRHTDTDLSATVETDADGRFRLPYLRVGPYEITIAHTGFRDNTQELTLTAGAAFELPVSLTVAGVDTQVVVTGHTTVLDAARTQIAGTVSQTEIGHLPLNGRRFLEVALLVPGVSPTNVASTQLFPETSAVPGISLSVGSQRNLSNNFIVDGLSANDDAAALSGITYGVDAIEQFQVVTAGGQAELGRALGGYFNVVTRSGTNEMRGSLYGYVRDDHFNAPNALSGTTLPMNQAQYGASLGGPIAANRTFYFANVEQQRLDQSGLTAIADDTIRAINSRLTAVGYRGPQVATGVYANPVDTTNALAKVDHRVSDHHQFSVRYSAYDARSRNSRGAGGLNAPSASSGLDNQDHTLATSYVLALSDRAVLEARAQIAHGDLEALPTDATGPAVSIAGVASFGRLSNSPTGRLNTMYQAVGNLSRQAGAHVLKGGVDVLFNDEVVTFPRAVGGAYAFSSLANFLAGTYNNAGFTQTFGATEVSQTNPNVGVYAQDEWTLSSRITVNLGVRYDLQFLDTIETDANNISPRLGLAWSPFDARRTVVRASAGLFFDRVPLRALANALLSAGNTTDIGSLRQIGVSLSPTQAGAPVFPRILETVVPSVTLPNLTTMDGTLQNAYSQQASVEIEQQLGDETTVSAGYHYVRGRRLVMAVNQNVSTCIAAGTNNGCRPNPAFANNSQYSSVGDSNYHGLHLSLVRRPTTWHNVRASYTLSTSKNNLGEFFFSSPIDPFDLTKDWGRSDNDQRHRLVLSGAINSPTAPATTRWERLSHAFQLSGMLQAYSALPFNVTSGVTTIQGTAGRPIVDGSFIERNAGIGSDVFQLSARLSRVFQVGKRANVELVVEGFNLTNRVNVVTRNANFGAGAYPANPSATFGQPTAVGEPRAFQFGARVSF